MDDLPHHAQRLFPLVVLAVFGSWIPFQVRRMRPEIEAGELTREAVMKFFCGYAVFLALVVMLANVAVWNPVIGLPQTVAGLGLIFIFVAGLRWVLFGSGAETLAVYAPAFNFPRASPKVVRVVVVVGIVLNIVVVALAILRRPRL